MTPVRQTKLYQGDGIGNGNCFAACLASLLDLPLWMVPPFEEMFGRGAGVWQERAEEWLARMFDLTLGLKAQHDPEQLPEFYIATGPSPRGVQHAVIYSRGELAHDPHYSDAGISEVRCCYFLVPLARDE